MRKCYLELLDAEYSGITRVKYNWAAQVKAMLSSIGFSFVWESQSYQTLCDNFGDMIERLREKVLADDWTRVQQSEFNDWYSSVKTYPEPAKYLQLRTSISKMRMVARFRLFSTKYSKFSVYTTQGVHTFRSDPESTCEVCNLREPETPAHFLWNCPAYSAQRKKFLKTSLLPLPDPEDQTQITNFFIYVTSCLKIRAFILDE